MIFAETQVMTNNMNAKDPTVLIALRHFIEAIAKVVLDDFHKHHRNNSNLHYRYIIYVIIVTADAYRIEKNSFNYQFLSNDTKMWLCYGFLRPGT